MYWLTFVLLSLMLYLPPPYLARAAWWWAAECDWWIPLLGWPLTPWQGYIFWLSVVYLGLATLLYLAVRRLPADSAPGQLARQISRAGLGVPGVLMWGTVLAILSLALYILPLGQIYRGWRWAISAPVAALAALYLLAEGLRLVETSLWADQAFAARRGHWLFEQGYHRYS